MSLWRLAVNKAIEEKNKNVSNFSHIRTIVDNVILNAGHVVSGGASLLQNHIGIQIRERLKHVVEKVEDDSISCHGKERVLFLQNLVSSLQQIERLNIESIAQQKNGVLEQEEKVNVNKQLTQVSDYNSLDENSFEALNFYEVFIQSKAIEGILLSMILEAPNNDEVNIVLEIFRLSLIEGNNIHIIIMHWIKDLEKVFSTYHEEILTRREELLQYAQVAICGLKKNVETMRINLEARNIKPKLLYSTKDMSSYIEDGERLFQQDCLITLEVLQKTLSKVRLHTNFTTLMLRNISIQNVETLENHEHKVNKLKVLLQSLAKTVIKVQKKISDHENRKNETKKFQQIKETEVSLVEKNLIAEIKTLEKKKDKLELQLEKVTSSLCNAETRLRNVKEERGQFKEASYKLIQHLQIKEEEHLTHISSYRREANVITTWKKFIEDTWHIQYTIIKRFEKEVTDELKIYKKLRIDMVIHTLEFYEKVFKNMIARFRIVARRLRSSEELEKTLHLDDETFLLTISREKLEKEYLHLEIEVINVFNIIECIQQLCTHDASCSREEEEKLRLLFATFQSIEEEFTSVQIPHQERNIANKLSQKGEPIKKNINKLNEMVDFTQNEVDKNLLLNTSSVLEFEEETLDLESEKLINQNFGDDIVDWEFDAIEK